MLLSPLFCINALGRGGGLSPPGASTPDVREGTNRLPYKDLASRRGERAQAGLNLISTRLQERRQNQTLSKVIGVFIDGESRPVSRDLVQNVARLPEIQGPEVVAVDHLCNAKSSAGDLLTPLPVLLVSWRPEGDVMDPANAHPSEPELRPLVNVDLGSGAAWSRLKYDGTL